MKLNKVLLIILDGFGYREECDHNAICQARKPHWDLLWGKYPHTTIDASEKWVGLPKAQMGNSEVGHMNIGAGRVIYQDYTKIENAIETGEFFQNPVLSRAVETARGGALHILGLLSPGGVHSHESQIHAMLDMAARGGVKNVLLHAFLDGRDTPPKSAEASLAALQEKCDALKVGRIASVCGRYYAMDRDQRWERVQPAYDLITQGRAEFRAATAIEALHAAYARGESDEFVKATVIAAAGVQPARMNDGDAVVFMNFRADRARQLTLALTDRAFKGFARGHFPKIGYFCTLTSYGGDFNLPAAFAPQTITNGFGEYLSKRGLRQLRIAETEKYAHVTYFFNGGIEKPFPGEDRVLVQSPKVATYDLKPEMSAAGIADAVVKAVEDATFDVMVVNFANADMVGHSGRIEPTVKAVETVDSCLGRIYTAIKQRGGSMIITADHGNAEQMIDPATGGPQTAHTTNPVPLIYVAEDANRFNLRTDGALQDISPTVLGALGIDQPKEMTGHDLRLKKQ